MGLGEAGRVEMMSDVMAEMTKSKKGCWGAKHAAMNGVAGRKKKKVNEMQQEENQKHAHTHTHAHAHTCTRAS